MSGIVALMVWFIVALFVGRGAARLPRAKSLCDVPATAIG
jgi:hypothetical protein